MAGVAPAWTVTSCGDAGGPGGQRAEEPSGPGPWQVGSDYTHLVSPGRGHALEAQSSSDKVSQSRDIMYSQCCNNVMRYQTGRLLGAHVARPVNTESVLHI